MKLKSQSTKNHENLTMLQKKAYILSTLTTEKNKGTS